MMRFAFRTIWISDIHLGSRGCQAVELCRFLDRVSCERLYLVGDIIDFWRLRGRPYWPQPHNDALQRLLALHQRGAEIIFIPGNHDEAARQYIGLEIGGVRILRHAEHPLADGRRLLVTHGDEYDLVVRHSRLISLLGSTAYEWLIVLNRWYNHLRAACGLSRSSFSQTVKMKVKSACRFISAFEETLLGEANRRGLQGVICGHIHKPAAIDGPAAYYNCGDWIEHCSALVELQDGRIELIRGTDVLMPEHAPGSIRDALTGAGNTLATT